MGKSRGYGHQRRKAHFSPTGACGRFPVAAEIRFAPRFHIGQIIQTRIGRNGFRSAWRLRSYLRLNINEPRGLQSRERKLETICLLGWIYRGQYQEERRKSQRIAEPGQFILYYHCLLDYESW